MTHRPCARCGAQTTKYRSYCRKCSFDFAEESRERTAKKNKELMDLAKSRPCHDCGLKAPGYIMELHHPKAARMSVRMPHKKLSGLVGESATVCANCLRERHEQSRIRLEREALLVENKFRAPLTRTTSERDDIGDVGQCGEIDLD